MISTIVLLGLASSVHATLHASITPTSRIVDFRTSNGKFYVDYSVTNVGENVEKFLPWYTPLDTVWEDIFDIRDKAGVKVPYNGKVARRVPTEDFHYTVMQPGETLKATVELSDSYQLSADGVYIVTLGKLENFVGKMGLPVYEQSNRVEMSFFAVAHQIEKILEARSDRDENATRFHPDGPRFSTSYLSMCSGSLLTEAQNGWTDANRVIPKAQACTTSTSVNSGNCQTQFTKWLGPNSYGGYKWIPYVDANWNYEASVWPSLNFLCCPTDSQDRIGTGCGSGCGPGLYGYVYPNDSGLKVHLCNAYYYKNDGSAQSLIEQQRTLTHECSHFYYAMNNDDFAYGEANCMALVANGTSNYYYRPYDRSFNNADSYCYYASYV